MRAEIPKLVGILNVTPDSFSDGGQFLDPHRALDHAQKLLEEGAEIIDIGADSTRPGSVCVGVEEEWRRLSPILNQLVGIAELSLDTHHAEVVRRASQYGISIVNDVSAASDQGMCQVIREGNLKVVLMATSCGRPHAFNDIQRVPDMVEFALSFLKSRIDFLLDQGIERSQIILDSGFGGFLSSEPRDSLAVIERYGEFADLNYPLMLGVSRKGVLQKLLGDLSIEERDFLSASYSLRAWQNSAGRAPSYLRTHNPRIHKLVFESFPAFNDVVK